MLGVCVPEEEGVVNSFRLRELVSLHLGALKVRLASERASETRLCTHCFGCGRRGPRNTTYFITYKAANTGH